MVRLLAGTVERVRHLVPELAKFGVVGAIGAVVDLGGSGALYGTAHLGPLTAKAIAVTGACVVTYLGSRFWTFRHRENHTLLRELILFIVLNGIGLIIAESVIAITAYSFGARNQLAYNAASIIGTGLGTIFRFFAYRKWVFLAPKSPPPVQEAGLGKAIH
jgi:putative flippase GtrA